MRLGPARQTVGVAFWNESSVDAFIPTLKLRVCQVLYDPVWCATLSARKRTSIAQRSAGFRR